MNATALALAAEALVGTPFRLHGRDPATGLDCIGVLAASLNACGKAALLPQGYALRNRVLPALDGFVAACGLEPACGPAEPGDVLLVRPGPGQVHLAITTDGGRSVHAHVGRGRVIHGHLPAQWPLVAHWRLRPEN